MDYSRIKGFNYQPSWGATGFDIWSHFDIDCMNRELSLGKHYFPGMNSIRLWLSYDAWVANSKQVEADFEAALAIADQHQLVVMPVLFNRWHSGIPDFGGIYVDHFLPYLRRGRSDHEFQRYVQAIVEPHAKDRRIFCWDLCNEPFYYARPPCELPEVTGAEYKWLEEIRDCCRKAGAAAPITVGMIMSLGVTELQRVEPLSDILSFHPYWIPPGLPCDFEAQVDAFLAFADQSGKPLLATETCWGDLDDVRRVENICYTLGVLKARGIGWMVYLLHHSLIADAHRPEFGPLSSPGNLAFIEADGSLRPGHDVLNEF